MSGVKKTAKDFFFLACCLLRGVAALHHQQIKLIITF